MPYMPKRFRWSESELPYFDSDRLASLFLEARAAGDVEAAAKVFQLFAWKMRPKLIGFSKRHLRMHGDHEEIADETVMRALKGALTSAETFRGTTFEELHGYLFRIERNVINDYRDKEMRRERIAPGVSLQDGREDLGPDGAEIEFVDDGFDEVVNGDLADQVMSGFNPKHRQIIQLRYDFGVKSKETAKITGMSVNNVDQVMRRFRRALREAYEAAQGQRAPDGDDGGHNGGELE